MKKELYVDLWTKHRESIKEALKKATDKPSIQLRGQDFEDAGGRPKSGYDFNLEFTNGEENPTPSGKAHGSAVARDLIKVLKESDKVMEILKSGHFRINMDKKFYLKISREA